MRIFIPQLPHAFDLPKAGAPFAAVVWGMAQFTITRKTWKETLAQSEGQPLLLPVAHDALTAKLIERAGFRAYQVGGFAVDGARYGFPDIDLTRYGEKHGAVREISGASSLPALVDTDDGYGDVKNVTHTIRGYEAMGVAAVFIEDQVSPKKCGHMADKSVVSRKLMEEKLRAAAAARDNPEALFILARTDAIEPEGLSEALRRGERYLKAGGDGIYVEGPTTEKELEKIGREFKGQPLATSILENGGKTPFLPPQQFYEMGFTMLLYPTTLLFRIARAIERGLQDLIAGKPIPPGEAVDMDRFEQIVNLPDWKKIEQEFQGSDKPSGG